MKRLMIVLLLAIACNHTTEDTNVKVKTSYAGEYYICMENQRSIYLAYAFEEKTWEEDEIVNKIGELDKLTITGYKVTNVAYPDQGNITLELYMGDDLLISSTSAESTTTIEYQF